MAVFSSRRFHFVYNFGIFLHTELDKLFVLRDDPMIFGDDRGDLRDMQGSELSPETFFVIFQRLNRNMCRPRV